MQTWTPSKQMQVLSIFVTPEEEELVVFEHAGRLSLPHVCSLIVQIPGSKMLLYQDPDNSEKFRKVAKKPRFCWFCSLVKQKKLRLRKNFLNRQQFFFLKVVFYRVATKFSSVIKTLQYLLQGSIAKYTCLLNFQNFYQFSEFQKKSKNFFEKNQK